MSTFEGPLLYIKSRNGANLGANTMIEEIGLPISILITALLGSINCLGMCGPIVFSTTQSPQDRWLYHFGRLGGLSWLSASLRPNWPNQLKFSHYPNSSSNLTGYRRVINSNRRIPTDSNGSDTLACNRLAKEIPNRT